MSVPTFNLKTLTILPRVHQVHGVTWRTGFRGIFLDLFQKNYMHKMLNLYQWFLSMTYSVNVNAVLKQMIIYLESGEIVIFFKSFFLNSRIELFENILDRVICFKVEFKIPLCLLYSNSTFCKKKNWGELFFQQLE